ncbi:MAG: hypothetical protein IBJ16_13480 [Chitinophagaceae bacterium]|nr:hypothetical protein [Chitinophagaceae bacterium]
MTRLLSICLLFISSMPLPAQKKTAFSIVGSLHQTQYDISKRQNAFGLGIGGKFSYKLARKLLLDVEVGKSIFSGTKELTVINGKPLYSKYGITHAYLGLQYPIIFPLSLASHWGHYSLDRESHHGFRQSALLAFSKKEKIHLRISFDHVFQDNELRKGDWGYWSSGLVVRLF